MSEAIRFPDIPLYQGWGAPHRLESEINDLEVVSGAVPAGLDGTLYRCGPDRQYPPMTKDDIFIDGEGMVCMFRFDRGHVDFKHKWVRNERFKRQEQARRSLFGRYRNRATNDPSVEGVSMGTSNTNVVWHGGKLLALKEDMLPFALDPDTLETRGLWDYDGAVKAVSMTAHPKLDLLRNELLTFSYQARGDGTTDCAFYIVDGSGRIEHEVWFNAPWPSMVHDFAVTETHVIFPFFPLITDLEVLKQGGPFYQWHGDEQSHFAVLPRRGRADEVRWFTGPAASAGHMLNATDSGSKLHLDLCLYEGNCFPFFPSHDGSATGPCPPMLTRLSFDLLGNAAGYEQQRLLNVPCEMPRTDDRLQGRPYRHGYMICRDPSGNRDGLSALGHIDLATGVLETWDPGPNSGVQEPQFVPRHAAAPEGDGWLLALVNRVAEMRSDLAVLDAQDLGAGPVALIRLPTRVRSTFHGMWVPSDALKTGTYEFSLPN